MLEKLGPSNSFCVLKCPSSVQKESVHYNNDNYSNNNKQILTFEKVKVMFGVFLFSYQNYSLSIEKSDWENYWQHLGDKAAHMESAQSALKGCN